MAGYGDRVPERDFEILVDTGVGRVAADARLCAGLWHVNYKETETETTTTTETGTQTFNFTAADVHTGGSVAFEYGGNNKARRVKVTTASNLLASASDNRWFDEVRLTVSSRTIDLHFKATKAATTGVGNDLKDDFETHGKITLTQGSLTPFVLDIAKEIAAGNISVDTSEQYRWTVKAGSQLLTDMSTFAGLVSASSAASCVLSYSKDVDTDVDVVVKKAGLMTPIVSGSGANTQLTLNLYDADTGEKKTSPFTPSKIPTGSSSLRHPGGLFHTNDYMYVYDWDDRKFYRIDMSDWLGETNQNSDISTGRFYASSVPRVLASWAQTTNQQAFALFHDVSSEIYRFNASGVQTSYIHFQMKENGNLSPVAIDADDDQKILYVLDSVKNLVFAYQYDTGEYRGEYAFSVEPVNIKNNFKHYGVTFSVTEKYFYIADKNTDNENFRVRAYNRIAD